MVSADAARYRSAAQSNSPPGRATTSELDDVRTDVALDKLGARGISAEEVERVPKN